MTKYKALIVKDSQQIVAVFIAPAHIFSMFSTVNSFLDEVEQIYDVEVYESYADSVEEFINSIDLSFYDNDDNFSEFVIV